MFIHSSGHRFRRRFQYKTVVAIISRCCRASFEKACLSCHNESKSRGGLSLATKSGLLKGSENGPVFEIGKPDESRILEVLLGDKPEMPKKAKPLDPTIIMSVSEWIRTGAVWPDSIKLADKSEGVEIKPLWSLQPIQNQKIPELPQSHQNWRRNAIDNFIAKDHISFGFKPTPKQTAVHLFVDCILT